jgi:glycosyltransferase involved in cell wall biosynthesis
MPSDNPLISVIMASHNNEKTIEEAIEGVAKQSYGNFELILIDDGSTDQTRIIMEKLVMESPDIRFMCNSLNIGKPLSINLGVLVSRGEFFAIADADDVWVEDKLEKQIKILQTDRKIDVLGGQLIRFGDWGVSSFPTRLPLSNREIHKLFNRGIMAINNPTAVIRKSAFLSVGGHKGYFRRNEDFDLFLRMHKNGNVFRNMEDTLIKYRTKSKIQPFDYWIKTEIGRQEILISNSNRLIRVFPILKLPFIVKDFMRLGMIFVFLWLMELNA